MLKLSDVLKDVDLKGFPFSGDLQKDINEYRKTMPLDFSEYGNIIAFRLSFGDAMTVHTLTDGVSKRVVNTKIENMPNGLPNKMKTSFLFEAKDNSVLFDDIIAIGGFLLGEDLVLISAYQDGNTIWQHSKQAYDGRSIQDIQFDKMPNDEELLMHGKMVVDRSMRKDTFAFITVLSLMLEAERTPILVDNGSKKSRKRNAGKNKKGGGWVERRIYIDAKYQSKQQGDHQPMDKEGKIKRDVSVQGFLRNQPYGPKHELRKWIYVEGFERSQWVNQGDKKITVDVRK